MLFTSLPGYDDLKERLIRAAQGPRVPQAVLFSGADGTPLVPLALAFVQYLFCADRRAEDSCGVCANCQKVSKLVHPDLHMLFPVSGTEGDTKSPSVDKLMGAFRTFILEQPYGRVPQWADSFGAGNRQPGYTVEDVRALIQDMSLAAYEGGYRVVFLWMPDLMRVESANALLKSLEEPGQRTVFILTTYQPERLLPTILSRVQHVRVRPPEVEELVEALVQKGLAQGEQAHEIAIAADGSFEAALEMAGKGPLPYQEFFAGWMRHCFSAKLFKEIFPMAEKFVALGREGQKAMLSYGLSVFRLVLRAQMGVGQASANQGFIEKFAQTLTPAQVEPIVKLLEDCAQQVERNINPRLLFVHTSNRMRDEMRRR